MIAKERTQFWSIRDKLSTFLEYYSRLYESCQQSEADCKQFLKGVVLPTMTTEQQLLDSEVSCKELDTSLQCLKLGKTRP